MGDREISVRSGVFFSFYSLLSTLYFLFSGESKVKCYRPLFWANNCYMAK
ncbi:MAG: hypothetical protein AB1422_17855 [bacterium]